MSVESTQMILEAGVTKLDILAARNDADSSLEDVVAAHSVASLI